MATKPIFPTYLSVPQAAKMLRCGQNAVYAAIEAGYLPAVRAGRGTKRKRYKIDPAALRGCVSERPPFAQIAPTSTSEYAEIEVG